PSGPLRLTFWNTLDGTHSPSPRSAVESASLHPGRTVVGNIMAQDTKVESASWWERFSDAISSFGEGIVNFLGRLFGSSNERYVRKLGFSRNRDGETVAAPGSMLARVNELEPLIRALTPEALKGLTPQFRACLAGEFEAVTYRKRVTETEKDEAPETQAEGAGGEESEGEEQAQRDPLEPGYTLEQLTAEQAAGQPGEGEE